MKAGQRYSLQLTLGLILQLREEEAMEIYKDKIWLLPEQKEINI
jgi:hypothetical protein